MANEISSVVREAISGDRVGRTVMADAISVVRDNLTGDRVGLTVMADAISVVRDSLTGDRVGINVAADVFVVVRESLIQEPPIRVAVATREALLRIEGDPVTVARTIAGYRQAVTMVRPTMALPSTVKSAQIVPTLREQIVLRATKRVWGRSGEFTVTLRMQSISRRNVLPAPQMVSFMRVGTYSTQVVQSRGKTYIAESAVYTRTQRQLVVAHRVVTLAPDVRTPITVRGQRQQVVLSRLKAVIVIMTEAHAASLAQQVVVENARPASRSTSRVGKLLHMTVQRHTVVPPGIDDRVGQMREQVVIERVPAPPFGVVHGRSLREQVVIERQASMHKSAIYGGSERMLTVLHRDTYAPAYAQGRHTSTLRQQIVAERNVGPVRGHDQVASLRLAFMLRRVTTRPIDVIDPGIGRHAASLAQLSVQRIVTTPPVTISKQTRYVYNVAAQVALGDTFPAPDMPPPEPTATDVRQVGQQVVHGDRGEWEPVSAVTVRSVGSMVVLSDDGEWIDATVPQSDVTSYSVQQAIAMGDVFPEVSMVQSDAEVAAIMSLVALGDSTMPDPMLPLSEIQALAVIEMAAVGDAQFPDPTIPLSEVRSSSLASFVAVHDPSLTGQFGMSETSVPSVLEFLIIRDLSLVGIPLRQGPRPIVTVSMS